MGIPWRGQDAPSVNAVSFGFLKTRRMSSAVANLDECFESWAGFRDALRGGIVGFGVVIGWHRCARENRFREET